MTQESIGSFQIKVQEIDARHAALVISLHRQDGSCIETQDCRVFCKFDTINVMLNKDAKPAKPGGAG